MTLDEARDHIGDGVVYRPPEPGPWDDRSEQGVITRVGDVWVFVTYGMPGSTPRATDPADLTLLAARLAANLEYQEALRDAETETFDGPGVEVQAMIAAATERRRRFRAGLRGETLCRSLAPSQNCSHCSYAGCTHCSRLQPVQFSRHAGLRGLTGSPAGG